MRLLADMHISPRTVEFLRSLGHEVVRVNEILPATASDEAIVARATEESRLS
jgi:predicted nuclease of predicted toxin-antitoxin system